MQINNLIIAMRYLFKQWFHKRNIIIVSEHKVNHIPISGGLQFCALILAAGGICWASYSTGSFMAARSALKEQTQVLRSVAGARVESNFVPLLRAPSLAEAPSETDSAELIVAGPMVTPSALEQNKLSARVIFLENKVNELEATNEAIIRRVRDKTSGRIDDLESIIKQTGLDPDNMKKEAIKDKPEPITNAKSEGGPYIPSDMINLPSSANEMFANLDELALLNQIVSTLPLAQPVTNAETQSGFGHRVDPFTGHLAFHSGIDLAGPVNNKIKSAADGTVVFAGRKSSYGNMIDVDHGFGVVTRYGHLRDILVKKGQKLRKGQILGIQGSTGRSTGPHLHYEVRYNDRPMNPKKFLAAGRYVSSKE